MRVTRKQRSYGNSIRNTNCQYPATFHGLHKWHNAMFEKLGWMVLAKKHGHNDKIVTYKNELKHLAEKIECKWNTISEKDRKDDLKILLDNVNILISHVASDFP